MFSISELNVGTGTIGIAPLVGRSGDYAGDLHKLLDWSPDLVLTLTQLSELKQVGSADLPTDLGLNEIKWLHFPIDDFQAPDAGMDPLWDVMQDILHTALTQKNRVIVHCMGGCGRSGMVALRLMCELGERAELALERLRTHRTCAVETNAQMLWATHGQISQH